MANDRKRELMLSYYPQECADILNGNSPFDVRFDFPYDWACEQITKYGGFYINMYCKKGPKYLYYEWNCDFYGVTNLRDLRDGWSRVCSPKERLRAYQEDGSILTNGHVVARAWCNHVTKIIPFGSNRKVTYKINFDDFDIFEQPKELKEFRPWDWSFFCGWTNCNCLFHTKEECKNCVDTHVKCAPQKYIFLAKEN